MSAYNSHKKVSFSAPDGLIISGDYYQVRRPKGIILLCHRSHFNRGEYSEIAPRLNEIGFSCLAIDQRSGMKVLGYKNETYSRAKKKHLGTGYNDAKQDIEAAILYLYKKTKQNIILVGSSYSASLALLIGYRHPYVKSIVGFSPGEYLKGISFSESTETISKPTFITGAKKEMQSIKKLFPKSVKGKVSFFTPKSEGAHGARALWQKTEDNQEYWGALKKFIL